MDDLIRGYFKKGEEQGFSKEYVRDTLIKKGYDPIRVRMIYNTLAVPHKEVQPRRPKSRFYNIASSAGGDAIHRIDGPRQTHTLSIAILVGTLFLAGATAFFLYAASGMPTGAVVLDEARTKDAQVALEEISLRDEQIAKKSRLIQEQLDEIDKLELTNEEKAQIIRRQLHEIQQLHRQIESQREDIHALLWDLMKDILRKGQAEPHKI